MRGLFFAKRPVKTVAQRLHKIGERGAGADTLTGGLGDDIFDYNALSEIGDSITDFEVGANGDVMDMIGCLPPSATAAAIRWATPACAHGRAAPTPSSRSTPPAPAAIRPW